MKNHIVILGWTSRTPDVARDIVHAEGRVRRFLRLLGARKLRVVILAEQVNARTAVELREHLGASWADDDVILRSGTPLRHEHLMRVDFARAAVILLPAGHLSVDEVSASDTRTIKTILSVSGFLRDLPPEVRRPLLVAEIFDPRRVETARSAYRGPIEIIANDEMIGRLITQSVRKRGMSRLFSDLLIPDEGCEFYLRDCPAELAGMPFGDASETFRHAILLGFVRDEGGVARPYLNPPPDVQLKASDRIAYIAADWSAGQAAVGKLPPVVELPGAVVAPPRPAPPVRRVLVLGWSRRVPQLLCEFDAYDSERFEVVNMARLAEAERRALLLDYGFRGERLQLTLRTGDFTLSTDLAGCSPGSLDCILYVSSDRAESEEESDARTLVGYLVLQEILATSGATPQVVVELNDPANGKLIDTARHEVIYTQSVLSHILAQVALRRELNAVFSELFSSSSTEFDFRDVTDFAPTASRATFGQLSAAVRRHGLIAVGLRLASSGGGEPRLSINPPRDEAVDLGPMDQVIVLATS